jgi:uracil-DNA glycosylase
MSGSSRCCERWACLRGCRPRRRQRHLQPRLRAAVAACQACSLGSTRRQTVFGVGHPQAHWMIVGEAPGEQEDLRGEPFVGAAGQLLDRMLQAIG